MICRQFNCYRKTAFLQLEQKQSIKKNSLCRSTVVKKTTETADDTPW